MGFGIVKRAVLGALEGDGFVLVEDCGFSARGVWFDVTRFGWYCGYVEFGARVLRCGRGGVFREFLLDDPALLGSVRDLLWRQFNRLSEAGSKMLDAGTEVCMERHAAGWREWRRCIRQIGDIT